MNKTTLIITFCLILVVKNAFTQNKLLDSLENKLKFTTNNYSKVLLLNNLGDELLLSNPEKSLKYIKQSIDLCDKNNFKTEKANALNIMGIYYRYMGDYAQSTTYHFQSLKLYEDLQNKKGIANALFNIGNILLIQKNYNSSLEYFKQSLQIREQSNEKKSIANCLNSMGIAYKFLGKLDTALVYYKKSLAIQKEIDDKSGIANALNNIAIIYYKKNDTTSTLAYFEKVIQIRKEMNDKFGQATILFNIGLILEDKGEYDKAIEKFNESMKISIEIGDSVRVKDNCEGLLETYALMKDFEKSSKYFDRFITLKDYINDEKKAKQITEIQTKYETEKKEKEITLLNKEKILQNLLLKDKETELEKQTLLYLTNKQKSAIETQKKEEKIVILKKDKEISEIALKNEEAKVKQQRIVILSIIAGLLILVVFSILLFRLYEQKKAANIILAEQKEEILENNEELNMQKEEILTQRDNLQLLNSELMQQKEEITTQRDEISIQSSIIEKHNKKITASIFYAQRIQKAILPLDATIKNFFAQHFIIFKPKDVVSGDFYWFEKKNEKIYFAAVDCTGHGVPGGFMSMLSYNLLNAAINDKNIAKPSEIINFISNQINKIIRQRTDDDSVKDGLDLAFCCYNSESMILEYAGVQSTIYHISNNMIKEYNSDWLPIGDSSQDNFFSYTNTEIQLERGDSIYLSTDGYTDQFGGELLKKFSKKQLKETLLSIHQFSLPKQKEILETKFESWKGSYEQIDDVLLIGIRI